ncbi:MAG: molybdenum cofactor guanylyltransferase, partial [Terriglobales bacterium]
NIAQHSEAIVTVPCCGGRLHTLCAIYRRQFAAVAEKALREGRNKIEPLFSAVPARIVDEEELKAVGFHPDIFDNVNTPEDWRRMQQRLGITR